MGTGFLCVHFLGCPCARPSATEMHGLEGRRAESVLLTGSAWDQRAGAETGADRPHRPQAPHGSHAEATLPLVLPPGVVIGRAGLRVRALGCSWVTLTARGSPGGGPSPGIKEHRVPPVRGPQLGGRQRGAAGPPAAASPLSNSRRGAGTQRWPGRRGWKGWQTPSSSGPPSSWSLSRALLAPGPHRPPFPPKGARRRKRKLWEQAGLWAVRGVPSRQPLWGGVELDARGQGKASCQPEGCCEYRRVCRGLCLGPGRGLTFWRAMPSRSPL